MCLSEAIPIVTDAAAVASGNPELLLASAATTAGNYMQTQANNASVDAQYKARDAALEQGVQNQQALQAKAQVPFNTAVQNFTPGAQNASLGDLITARQNTINSSVKTPSSFIDPTSNANAPQIVQDSLAQKMGNATQFNNQQGAALATLGGLNDQNVANNLALNTSGNQIGMYDQFAKGQAVADQASTNAAYNNARKSPSALGEALSGAGTALGLDNFTGTTNINGFLGGANGAPVINPATGMTAPESSFLTKTQQNVPMPWLQS